MPFTAQFFEEVLISNFYLLAFLSDAGEGYVVPRATFGLFHMTVLSLHSREEYAAFYICQVGKQ